MIRVVLTAHLKMLAQISGSEVALEVPAPATQGKVIDALEAKFPALRGTLRDYATRQRRDYVRFFACEEDISLAGMEAALPEAVAAGREPLIIIGAIAGG